MSLFSLLKKCYKAFSGRERISFLVAAAVFLIAGTALAVLIVANTTEVVPTEGGTYHEGMVGQPTFVNPVLASSHVDKSLVRLLFADLSDLAQKIEVESGGRVVKVRLKNNIYWSDGRKITSDDVIFTIETIQDPQTSSPLFSAWQGVTPSRGSELEVLFRLASPLAFFEHNLSNLYIIPKHVFADIPTANWRLSNFNLQPVSSGPYKFYSHLKRPDGFISLFKLEENPAFPGNKPLVKSFEVRFYPRYEELLQAFNGGKVDGFMNLVYRNLDEVKRPFATTLFPSPTVYGLFFNQSQNLALQSRAVRSVLSASIDREDLAQQVFGDQAQPATGPIPPAILPSVATTTKPVALSELETRLENAGWTLGEDGIRSRTIDSSSVPLSVDVIVPDTAFLTKTANYLKNQWGKLGIKVGIITAPPGEGAAEVIKNRNYQAILFGNSLRKTGDLFSFWHSSERFYPGLNLSLYENSRVDQLIEQARHNFNEAERQEQLLGIHNLLLEDMPAVFLYTPYYPYIHSQDVGGIEEQLLETPADRFDNVEQWFLNTARVIKG